MGNVLIQPHLAAVSPQYMELFVEELAERINADELSGRFTWGQKHLPIKSEIDRRADL
jgi:phosphoglycerate dehydrogenase-like enzyme